MIVGDVLVRSVGLFHPADRPLGASLQTHGAVTAGAAGEAAVRLVSGVGDAETAAVLRAEELLGEAALRDHLELLLGHQRAAGRPPLPRLLTALGIPGVGPAAARRLAAQFATLDLLLATDEAQLASIAGVSPATAGNIRAFFASPGGRKLLEELRTMDLPAEARALRVGG